MELYLKAFLIHEIGKIPRTTPSHDLGRLLLESAKNDAFFKDILNSPNFDATWASYLLFLRYPDPPQNEGRPRSRLPIIGVEDLDNLDSVASHVRKVVAFPNTHTDVISDILDGTLPVGMVPYASVHLLKESFLRDNRWFSDQYTYTNSIRWHHILDRLP